MDTSLCYLLRTVLAKSEKDKLRTASSSFEEVKDITKLERHLIQVFERIPKKSRGPDQEFVTEDEGKFKLVTIIYNQYTSLLKWIKIS